MISASFQKLFETIPHPIFAGCVAIALGVILIGFASPIKSKADRARNSKAQGNRRRARTLHWSFVLLLVFGAALTGLGTWLTIDGARGDAAVQVKAAQNLLDQTRKENEQARKEFDTKFQTVLFALNAAKAEQTRLLNEEKIKGIRTNFLQWAQDFAGRKPDKQRQFEQAKIAERQKEIQISSDSMPLFLFVTRFIQEVFTAYIKENKDAPEIKILMSPLPENFYDAMASQKPSDIQFGPKARWNIYAYGNLPATEDQNPFLRINFTSSDGRSGYAEIRRIPKTKKFSISGGGTLPVPNATPLFGDYEMEDYEETIRRIFQQFIEGQLVDVPMATPSPSTSP
jgi:hypothetical protein